MNHGWVGLYVQYIPKMSLLLIISSVCLDGTTYCVKSIFPLLPEVLNSCFHKASYLIFPGTYRAQNKIHTNIYLRAQFSSSVGSSFAQYGEWFEIYFGMMSACNFSLLLKLPLEILTSFYLTAELKRGQKVSQRSIFRRMLRLFLFFY